MARRATRPIAIHCQVTDSGEVLPDPGYENRFMEHDGYRGNAQFIVLPAQKGEPEQVICTVGRLAEDDELPLRTPIFSNVWLDYTETLTPFPGSPISWEKESVTSGLLGSNYNGPYEGGAITVDNGSERTTVFDKVWLYRFVGDAYPEAPLLPGFNNQPVSGSVTLKVDVWQVVYDLATFGPEVRSYLDTWTWVVPFNGTTPAGVPADGGSYATMSVADIDTVSFLTLGGLNQFTSVEVPGVTLTVPYLTNLRME